jgi:acyl carrier protein
VNSVLDNEAAVSRIRNFVFQTFPVARKRKVADSADLLEGGIVDSLGVLDLVGFLQQEFAVAIDDEDLVPENFKSIECMAQFVERVGERQPKSV